VAQIPIVPQRGLHQIVSPIPEVGSSGPRWRRRALWLVSGLELASWRGVGFSAFASVYAAGIASAGGIVLAEDIVPALCVVSVVRSVSARGFVSPSATASAVWFSSQSGWWSAGLGGNSGSRFLPQRTLDPTPTPNTTP
jgi:hypothetical protein